MLTETMLVVVKDVNNENNRYVHGVQHPRVLDNFGCVCIYICIGDNT